MDRHRRARDLLSLPQGFGAAVRKLAKLYPNAGWALCSSVEVAPEQQPRGC